MSCDVTLPPFAVLGLPCPWLQIRLKDRLAARSWCFWNAFRCVVFSPLSVKTRDPLLPKISLRRLRRNWCLAFQLTIPCDSPGVLLKQFRHQPDSSWNPSGPMKQFRLNPWPIGQQTRVSLRSALGPCPQTSLCLSALEGNFVFQSSSTTSSLVSRVVVVPFQIKEIQQENF